MSGGWLVYLVTNIEKQTFKSNCTYESSQPSKANSLLGATNIVSDTIALQLGCDKETLKSQLFPGDHYNPAEGWRFAPRKLPGWVDWYLQLFYQNSIEYHNFWEYVKFEAILF